MASRTSFLTPEETSHGETFLTQGYVVVPAEEPATAKRIQEVAADLATGHLGLKRTTDPQGLLDSIHEHVDARSLNDLRLAVIGGLRDTAWFRPSYYSLVRSALSALVGSELAMQRGIGLSVQLPGDTSSILPLHADVWDGDSAFEVVVWTPLVDCFATKSMFLIPLEKDRALQGKMRSMQSDSVEDFYQLIRDDAVFLDVPFGSVLIFSQTLMHGNRLNGEAETRWSMNCRFKSLLSPYADKRLGEFFEPITLKPATRLGTEYSMPEGFDE